MAELARGALSAWGPRWMSAAAECGGAFREERGFILSLASCDAWRVSGRALHSFAARARIASCARTTSVGAGGRVERLFAVRTYTGSPHCAEAQSSRAAPITPSPSVTGHPWRRGLTSSRLPEWPAINLRWGGAMRKAQRALRWAAPMALSSTRLGRRLAAVRMEVPQGGWSPGLSVCYREASLSRVRTEHS